MPLPKLQTRDYEILRPLVYCYRITNSHIESRRHAISNITARKRLDRLADGHFVNRLTAWASDIPLITAPIHAWQPGQPTPDFGSIAHATQQRWTQRPIRKTVVYVASNKLLCMFGLPRRSHIKLLQATHDLGVAESFLFCQQRWPQLHFVGEDMFAHQRGNGQVVEDAQLVDNHGSVFAVAEFAGSYRKQRLQHFHQQVGLERGLPYFLF